MFWLFNARAEAEAKKVVAERAQRRLYRALFKEYNTTREDAARMADLWPLLRFSSRLNDPRSVNGSLMVLWWQVEVHGSKGSRFGLRSNRVLVVGCMCGCAP